MTYRRKRYQEALKAMKDICKSPRTTTPQKLRAAELIAIFYGLELPSGLSKRDQKDIKTLLVERSLVKTIRKQVNEKMQEDESERAEGEQNAMMERFLLGTSA